MKRLGTHKLILGILLLAVFLEGCQNKNDSAPTADIQSNLNADWNDSEGIIGGAPVKATDSIAKSTVGIVDLRGPGVICTGSIVGDQVILTAAHCAEEAQYLAILFSANIPQTLADWKKAVSAKTLVGLAGVKINEKWFEHSDSQLKEWGDVALLKINGTLPTGFVKAQMIRDSSSLRAGQNVTLAGYGITDGVRQTETDVLRKTTVKMSDPKFSSMEVVFDQTQGRGACHGDSGGPAYVTLAGKQVLLGVTSRGYKDPQDTCQRYAIYSNVAAFASWIQTSIAESSWD